MYLPRSRRKERFGMPKERVKTYGTDSIAVRFEPRRCIHAAQCVFGLPDVFDPERKPWIEPGKAAADAIARVIARCPTGALHFDRRDAGAPEAPDADVSVRVTRNGPLYVRGAIEMQLPDGSVVQDVRVALCRCGGTQNPPFCDNSHRAIRFVDRGEVFEGGAKTDGPDRPGLEVTVEEGGPYRIAGPFTILSDDGRVQVSGSRAALCRCGASRNKPFCDGSHETPDATAL
jgi:CDGSH-type Zn-finger protein/uncharacterized Fe-S cluster protein YjdI